MIKSIFAAGALVAVSACTAYAGDIPATPTNHGPMVIRGMGVAGDIANIGLTPVNIVTQPILAPGASPMAAEPMAAPMKKHRRHHRMMKKHM